MNGGTIRDPAMTHTLEEFIEMKTGDNFTYRNFSILDKFGDVECLDHNLIDDYMDVIEKLTQTVTLSREEFGKYKYSPDLLAYDIYGSVQLDFIILFINDMVDPKEFNRQTIKLPYASVMAELLSEIYNSDQEYIKYNRSNTGTELTIV